MDRLCASFETLAEEMKIIRQILDRILDDFQWALNQESFGPDAFPKTAALVAMLAEHLAEKVHNGSDDVSEAEPAPADPVALPVTDQPAPCSQAELWQ